MDLGNCGSLPNLTFLRFGSPKAPALPIMGKHEGVQRPPVDRLFCITNVGDPPKLPVIAYVPPWRYPRCRGVFPIHLNGACGQMTLALQDSNTLGSSVGVAGLKDAIVLGLWVGNKSQKAEKAT